MALPKLSTGALNIYADPLLGSATSPTTSPAASSKPEDSDPNYTLNYEEPVNLNWLRLIFVVAGVIVAALAVVMWLVSVFGARVTENIENNQLITGGIYAWVRHPIYAAFLFLNAGILLVQANYVLLILPAVYWLALTVLMKRTEERWLRRQFGQQYVDYESCVNRIMPWPPR